MKMVEKKNTMVCWGPIVAPYCASLQRARRINRRDHCPPILASGSALSTRATATTSWRAAGARMLVERGPSASRSQRMLLFLCLLMRLVCSCQCACLCPCPGAWSCPFRINLSSLLLRQEHRGTEKNLSRVNPWSAAPGPGPTGPGRRDRLPGFPSRRPRDPASFSKRIDSSIQSGKIMIISKERSSSDFGDIIFLRASV